MKTTTHYTGHRWTNEELKTLMIMWANDDPIAIIEDALKVTHVAILKQVQRMRKSGIPLKRRTRGHKHGSRNKPWTKGQVEYLVRRRNDKATAEEIAQDLERTPTAVNAMIGRLREEGVDVAMRGNGVRRLWDVNELKALNITIQSEVSAR